MPTTPSTAKRQHDFAAALLDPAQPLPEGLVGPDGRPSLKRFNVYRNNVVAGLTATLKDAFPAVARIVGEEFFLAMGRIYVALDPPGTNDTHQPRQHNPQASHDELSEIFRNRSTMLAARCHCASSLVSCFRPARVSE